MFFFFKQKTAYEMRISDWSSDVCSSDLGTSAVDEVLAFFSEWGPTIKDMRDSMERRFTPETVWENVGASKTVGSEQALAFTDAFNAQMSVEIGRASCRDRVCQSV